MRHNAQCGSSGQAFGRLRRPGFIPDRTKEFSESPGRQPEQRTGKPDIFEFTADHRPAPLAEEFFDADGRYFDGMPGKKVARGTERSEEGNSESAIGESVENAVRSRHDKEKREEAPPRAGEADDLLELAPDDQERPEQSERQGVGQTAMTEHVFIIDAEPESDDISIGEDS